MANETKTKQEGIFVKPIPSVNWNYMSNANDQQIYTQNLDRLIKRQDNKTELQKAENRDTANFYQKYYNQMNGFVKIGDKTYENNMKAFFNKKVDDYNAINTAIDKGIIDHKMYFKLKKMIEIYLTKKFKRRIGNGKGKSND